MTVRVVLADDQPLVRNGLRVLMADAPDIDVAGEAGTGTEAVQLVRNTEPDVAVMDIRMPGMDGIEATGADHGSRWNDRRASLSSPRSTMTSASTVRSERVRADSSSRTWHWTTSSGLSAWSPPETP